MGKKTATKIRNTCMTPPVCYNKRNIGMRMSTVHLFCTGMTHLPLHLLLLVVLDMLIFCLSCTPTRGKLNTLCGTFLNRILTPLVYEFNRSEIKPECQPSHHTTTFNYMQLSCIFFMHQSFDLIRNKVLKLKDL